MSLAWLSYLPVPGLPWIAVWSAPDDALTRYHAWQGGVLVGLSYVLLLVVGLLARLHDAPGYLATMGLVAGVAGLAAVGGMAWGAVGAARRRFVRVRPVWDLLVAAQR